MKSPAARVASPTTPMLTPIPMPILSPVLSAPSPVAAEDVSGAAAAVHAVLLLPVSSAKSQPLMWAARTLVVVLVVSVVTSHFW